MCWFHNAAEVAVDNGPAERKYLEWGKCFIGTQCVIAAGIEICEGVTIGSCTYVRESIVNPAGRVVAGYQPVMPTYQGLVSEEQVIALIAYIESLQIPVGDTTPAPAGAN